MISYSYNQKLSFYSFELAITLSDEKNEYYVFSNIVSAKYYAMSNNYTKVKTVFDRIKYMVEDFDKFNCYTLIMDEIEIYHLFYLDNYQEFFKKYIYLIDKYQTINNYLEIYEILSLTFIVSKKRKIKQGNKRKSLIIQL